MISKAMLEFETSTPGSREADVLRRGLEQLRRLLPDDWAVEVAVEPTSDRRVDALATIQEPQGGRARLILEVKRTVSPRDVDTVLGGQLRLLRSLDPEAGVVVVASWLSPRTRALLEERGIGYLDLAGNALLRIARPPLFIRTAGAAEPPTPPRREGVSLRGTVAGRAIRLLADVRPPYTGSAIAQASRVSTAQMSRLLALLDREALIERGPRGIVVGVDWAGLLRRRAESYQLFKTNRARGYVSGSGPEELLRRLRQEPGLYRALTGSFAAAQRAPVAAPNQLTVYVDNIDRTAEALSLLPANRGADTVLLRAYDDIVLERLDKVEGATVVAISQLALDCLSGNGRMPAEGEALLDWMATHESDWRLSGISELQR